MVKRTNEKQDLFRDKWVPFKGISDFFKDIVKDIALDNRHLREQKGRKL